MREQEDATGGNGTRQVNWRSGRGAAIDIEHHVIGAGQRNGRTSSIVDLDSLSITGLTLQVLRDKQIGWRGRVNGRGLARGKRDQGDNRKEQQACEDTGSRHGRTFSRTGW